MRRDLKNLYRRVTLMQYVQPGDDYKLTPFRLLAGIAAFGLLLFGPSIAGAMIGY